MYPWMGIAWCNGIGKGNNNKICLTFVHICDVLEFTDVLMLKATLHTDWPVTGREYRLKSLNAVRERDYGFRSSLAFSRRV